VSSTLKIEVADLRRKKELKSTTCIPAAERTPEPKESLTGGGANKGDMQKKNGMTCRRGGGQVSRGKATTMGEYFRGEGGAILPSGRMFNSLLEKCDHADTWVNELPDA